MPIQSLSRFLLSAALGLSGLATAVGASAEEATNIHHISAETCKACHQEIYKQWQGSMHAQSTALD